MFDISFEKELDALREALGNCRLAAFADLSARMVLRVSADERPRREEIDALCDLAVTCLDGPALPALLDGEPPFSAVVAGTEESRFFIRSLSDPSDALILIVGEPVEQAGIWAAAQDLLNRHSAGEDAS
ncbi:MAG: hypothetical protein QNJ13_02475 [Paracoccaceae bacterium]|nr:hypothetical protein [Paracoccaceae bacterium]